MRQGAWPFSDNSYGSLPPPILPHHIQPLYLSKLEQCRLLRLFYCPQDSGLWCVGRDLSGKQLCLYYLSLQFQYHTSTCNLIICYKQTPGMQTRLSTPLEQTISAFQETLTGDLWNGNLELFFRKKIFPRINKTSFFWRAFIYLLICPRRVSNKYLTLYCISQFSGRPDTADWWWWQSKKLLLSTEDKCGQEHNVCRYSEIPDLSHTLR